MGIGDKQRIERERRDKYMDAIKDGAGYDEVILAGVLAVADAEIEPLQDQIERDGERIATQITAGLERNALRDALRREIEHMGREDDTMSKYWRDRLQNLLDAEVPEPVYEYSFKTSDGYMSGMRYDSEEEAQKALDGLKRPHDWHIVRRTKGQWEGVK